jgi:hypothetical protein
LGVSCWQSVCKSCWTAWIAVASEADMREASCWRNAAVSWLTAALASAGIRDGANADSPASLGCACGRSGVEPADVFPPRAGSHLEAH